MRRRDQGSTRLFLRQPMLESKREINSTILRIADFHADKDSMWRNQVTTFVLCLASIQALVFIAFRRATAQDAPSPRPPVSLNDLSACDGLGCDQECDYGMLAKDPSPTASLSVTPVVT